MEDSDGATMSRKVDAGAQTKVAQRLGTVVTLSKRNVSKLLGKDDPDGD